MCQETCNSIRHIWLKCQLTLQSEMCMCLPCYYFQSIITNTTMSSLSLNIAVLRDLSKSTGVSWVTLARVPPPADLPFVISQLHPLPSVVPRLGWDIFLLSSGYSWRPAYSVDNRTILWLVVQLLSHLPSAFNKLSISGLYPTTGLVQDLEF